VKFMPKNFRSEMMDKELPNSSYVDYAFIIYARMSS